MILRYQNIPLPFRSQFLSKQERETTIHKNGMCQTPVFETLSGKCKSDITKFPNDIHHCSFHFYILNIDYNIGRLKFELRESQDEIIPGAWSVESMWLFFCYASDFKSLPFRLSFPSEPFLILHSFEPLCS